MLEVADQLFSTLAAANLEEFGFTIDPHHSAMRGAAATAVDGLGRTDPDDHGTALLGG